jgi:hypothetical protein
VVLLPPLDGVARALGVARIHSSISHSESLAVGLAVVEVLENKAVQVDIPVHVPDPAPASFPHQTQENGTTSPTATEEH